MPTLDHHVCRPHSCYLPGRPVDVVHGLDAVAHQDLGLKVLHRVRDDIEELGKIELLPKMEGRQMIMVVAPLK